MKIYDRDALAAETAWELYSQISQTPSIWSAETFQASARHCGMHRIMRRRTYFSFTAECHTTGQAIINQGMTEEIRFFIGREFKGLNEELWRRDQAKIPKLATEYSKLFTRQLGKPRKLYGNNIYEHQDHRIRVLSAECVWLVISNLSVMKELKLDYFPAD